MAQVEVIPWTYRDGSVNLELRCATFTPQDDVGGVLVTHSMIGNTPLTTLCGQVYRYKGPVSYGLQRSGTIDCPECRTLLSACTFTCEVGVHDASRKVR